MNRREFSAKLLATGVGLAAFGIGGTASAQGGAPVEGTHYVKLSQALPVAPGKIEVIEFFWYGCPHCNAFEPALDAWQKKLPPMWPSAASGGVPRGALHRAPEDLLRARCDGPHPDHAPQGVLRDPHDRASAWTSRPRLPTFMAKNGVDSAKFLENYNSFSTATKVKQASKLAADYKIDGVPAIGITASTSRRDARGLDRCSLAVADYLIQRERKA
jgi:thiol:disulfide interchange protein DsbA